jgi:hypothetical protein
MNGLSEENVMSDPARPLEVESPQPPSAKQEFPQEDLWSPTAKIPIPWFSGISGKFLTLGLGMVGVSLILQRFSWWISKPHESLAGFISNVAAEFLLIGLSLPVVAWFAGRKFAETGPYVVKLIAQLRKDKKIEPHSARRAVICAVSLISEDSLGTIRSDNANSTNQTCLVCYLPVTSEKKCPYCLLSKGIWDSDELRKINQPAEKSKN